MLLERGNNSLHGCWLVAIGDGFQDCKMAVRGLCDFMELRQKLCKDRLLLRVCAELQQALHHARRVMSKGDFVHLLRNLIHHLLKKLLALFLGRGSISHDIPIHFQSLH